MPKITDRQTIVDPTIGLPAQKKRRGVQESNSTSSQYPEEKISVLKNCVKTVLTCIGEDVTREGLLDTPKRVAKAWMDVSIGYRQDTVGMLGVTSDRPGGAFFSDGTVAQGSNGIVIVRDIDFASTNEATLLPFHGRCHIGYIPSAGVVLGLSKLARITKHFGKRLQSQQGLVTDIASCLQTHLQCQGIAVYAEAKQIMPLNVEEPRQEICLGGCFADDEDQFQEFLALLNKPVPSKSSIHILSSSKTSSPDCHQLRPISPALSADSGAAEGDIQICSASSPSSEDSTICLTDGPVASALGCAPNSTSSKMASAINEMIRQIGEDPQSQNLCKSAMRYASGLLASTQGYSMSLPSKETSLVASKTCDLNILRDISYTMADGARGRSSVATASVIFNSQCEHHMLPFYGRVLVAYMMPQGTEKVLGRCAIEQVVRVYTQRLQVQERITHQLADAVCELSGSAGVMVVCQAAHMCMLARGVENHSGATSTFAVRGTFEGSVELRKCVLQAFNA
ncbi:hypothetical protein CEUSTIGMA_g5513.t1 [Chlamydomonas eustigma]|uniref:GTP cyclohydrolase 1 n=1 Tax=Chlamydomonas eustigma TaxID=1157962 RepID=A0A250X4T3_9CHLO|nr:hypothetical protein CEUSTIGMA_g5513.t1 [Chlamydomonas eustigma]|eukprot:GAX78071.1 hypothetical protein CEUSTIGMA_g5513.t1 [Chlamydomonas eustigma]